jgi:DNA-directed RNA polymerase specialized sigma subunit
MGERFVGFISVGCEKNDSALISGCKALLTRLLISYKAVDEISHTTNRKIKGSAVNDADTEFWKEKLARLYPSMEKAVRLRFKNEPDKVEEALSFVSEKLLEDNMRRLALYDPARGAKFETYFSVLVHRLISKYLEGHRKRKRFPKWLERQDNALWFMVYRLLCWELRSESAVVEYLEVSAPGKRDETVVAEAVRVIRETYPDCGRDQMAEMATEETDLDREGRVEGLSSFHQASPEEQIAYKQLIALADAVFNDSAGEGTRTEEGPGELADLKRTLRSAFKPTPEKRLFLRMIFQDGMTVSRAGRMLGWNSHQASGHYRRLMALLKDILGDEFSI